MLLNISVQTASLICYDFQGIRGFGDVQVALFLKAQSHLFNLTTNMSLQKDFQNRCMGICYASLTYLSFLTLKKYVKILR